MSIALRPYQTDLIARTREAFRSHRRVLLQSPTGSGKTVLFAWLARTVAERGKRVAILVHRRELVRQTGDKLTALGVPYGTITAGGRKPCRLPVAVASVQTLARRLALYPDAFDLIVVDEAHHAVAGQWRAVTDAYPAARILGVTATPERMDGKGLASAFDHMEVGPSVRELIEGGFLADYTAFAPPDGGPDLTGIRTKMGDFDLAALASVMGGAKLVGDAVEHYTRYGDGRPAVAFCVTVKHAELVADQFRAAGYRACAVDGTLDAAERDRRIRGLETGEVQVLASCDLISEGLDIPGISAAILLRPTKSLGLYLQQVGRALRPKDGRAVILDHAGNVHRHGLPCAERPWSLTHDRKKKESAAPLKLCGECYAYVALAARECPHCGHEFEGAGRAEPGTKAGELVEVKPVDPGRPFRLRKAELDAATAQCTSLADYQALARSLGYKPGWAWHQWQARAQRRPQMRDPLDRTLDRMLDARLADAAA